MEREKKLSKPTGRAKVLVRGKLCCKNRGGREEQRGENEDDGNGCECFVKRKRVVAKISRDKRFLRKMGEVWFKMRLREESVHE